jgi:hypothetical protein
VTFRAFPSSDGAAPRRYRPPVLLHEVVEGAGAATPGSPALVAGPATTSFADVAGDRVAFIGETPEVLGERLRGG